LEPVLQLQFLFPGHTRSELRTLSEVSLMRDFPGLRSDPGRQGLAQVFAEILLRYHPGASDSPEFHDLLLAAQESLESSSPERGALQARFCAFLLRFCRASGFQPQFRTCVYCGIEVSGHALTFLLDQGGPVCSDHRVEGGLLMRESLVHWLDALQNDKEPPEANRVEAWRSETFLLNYLGRHAGGEKKLQSLAVWHAMTADTG
jgi:recombinational DNA repair protein (RecF pathway)